MCQAFVRANDEHLENYRPQNCGSLSSTNGPRTAGNEIWKWAFTADITAKAIVKADKVNFMTLKLLEGSLLKSVATVGRQEIRLKKDREKGSQIVFKPQGALRAKVEGEKVFFSFVCIPLTQGGTGSRAWALERLRSDSEADKKGGTPPSPGMARLQAKQEANTTRLVFMNGCSGKDKSPLHNLRSTLEAYI
jgi:hypothetical protein